VPAWTLWAVVGVSLWVGLTILVLVTLERVDPGDERVDQDAFRVRRVPARAPAVGAARSDPMPALDEPLSILVVDDDPSLRALLRASFELAHLNVEEADGAYTAFTKIEERPPDVIVLDVAMPVVDGLQFCRSLKADPSTRCIPVVLLTGDALSNEMLVRVQADAHLRKPFSPLALLGVVERLAGDVAAERVPTAPNAGEEQLLLYARDFRRVLEVERAQRALLQDAYRDTVVALARALESKDGLTGAHSERVRRYATKLAATVESSALEEPTLEYGFILHDIGKIGIPDRILRKRSPLAPAERRLIETHTVLGEQMIGEAVMLRGEGARVVRSHHERWDGRGYPDAKRGEEIPLGARIFSVADALDAMTSDRPYRKARPWKEAVAEIVAQAGGQFDPQVVEAFRETERELRAVHYALNTNYEPSVN
jgi:response regulator RpfG family c-di-GMP phosphodiesterase